jgi:Uma2 family endonuclease
MTLDLIGIAEESTVRVEPDRPMSSDEFFDFCQANSFFRIERMADGEIVIMPPAGDESSHECARMNARLFNWAERDGRGRVFDSSAGFKLPNGATLSPDASWISHVRLATVTREQIRKFAPICPDFVVEVQSPSDSVPRLKRKMHEWIHNGAQLGWLILPDSKTVYVYRPGQEPEFLTNITQLKGEGPVEGFVLDLTEIWSQL